VKRKMITLVYLVLHFFVFGYLMYSASVGYPIGLMIFPEIRVIHWFWGFAWIYAWVLLFADTLICQFLYKKLNTNPPTAKIVFATDIAILLYSAGWFVLMNVYYLTFNLENLLYPNYWCYWISFVPLCIFCFFWRRRLYHETL